MAIKPPWMLWSRTPRIRGQPGDLPLAWAKGYGQGRVFYTALGHREDVWHSSLYQQPVLGGIRWVLGR